MYRVCSVLFTPLMTGGDARSPWDHSGLVWEHKGRKYIIDSGSFRYYDL